MSAILDPLTFDELCQIERESKSNTLKPCRPDLYQAMAELLNKMRKEYEDSIAMEMDPDISDGLRTKMGKAEKHCKNITTNRSIRIMTMAVRSADGVNKDLKSMTDEEREMYEKAVELAKHHLGTVDRKRGLKERTTRIDSKAFIEKTAEKHSVIPIADDGTVLDVPDEEPVYDDDEAFIKPTVEAEKASPEPVAEKTDKNIQKFVLVRILDDIPPFAGNERDYYLVKEDLVTLPENMATALINSNKAVKVNPEP